MSKRQKPDPSRILNSLAKDFHDLVTNKQALRIAVENFFNNVVDEITLGIIFDSHRKYKTNAYDLELEDSGEDNDVDGDVFAQYNLKNAQDCICPYCDRSVAPTKFASHLEGCMGIGRKSSRYSSRRVTTTSSDRDNSSYGGETPSDDDDDVWWNTGDRRKKKKDRNSMKKNRGTPKKAVDIAPVEPATIDIEGNDDDLTNLQDILHLQDHSNSTSPAGSASSSGSTKKKEKSRSKKSGKKDRSSPAMNMAIE